MGQKYISVGAAVRRLNDKLEPYGAPALVLANGIKLSDAEPPGAYVMWIEPNGSTNGGPFPYERLQVVAAVEP